jgi:hypothetical protein
MTRIESVIVETHDRIVINSPVGPFTDADGFIWDAA